MRVRFDLASLEFRAAFRSYYTQLNVTICQTKLNAYARMGSLFIEVPGQMEYAMIAQGQVSYLDTSSLQVLSKVKYFMVFTIFLD